VPWELLDAQTRDSAMHLRFRVAPGTAPQAQWPAGVDATLEITVGNALAIALATRNNGAQPLTLTEALHTYFEVGDVRSVAVHGLDGLSYLDKVDGLARKRQTGAVTVSGEVDRIYLDSVTDCIIDDPISNRRIRIAKSGSRSTVVWNPWIEKAAKMGDLGEDGYLKMICVESGNAAENIVQVAPGTEHRMTVRYTVEPL
jgi:D-hexose-6-phosphate mutarotase